MSYSKKTNNLISSSSSVSSSSIKTIFVANKELDYSETECKFIPKKSKFWAEGSSTDTSTSVFSPFSINRGIINKTPKTPYVYIEKPRSSLSNSSGDNSKYCLSKGSQSSKVFIEFEKIKVTRSTQTWTTYLITPPTSEVEPITSDSEYTPTTPQNSYGSDVSQTSQSQASQTSFHKCSSKKSEISSTTKVIQGGGIYASLYGEQLPQIYTSISQYKNQGEWPLRTSRKIKLKTTSAAMTPIVTDDSVSMTPIVTDDSMSMNGIEECDSLWEMENRKNKMKTGTESYNTKAALSCANTKKTTSGVKSRTPKVNFDSSSDLICKGNTGPLQSKNNFLRLSEDPPTQKKNANARTCTKPTTAYLKATLTRIVKTPDKTSDVKKADGKKSKRKNEYVVMLLTKNDPKKVACNEAEPTHENGNLFHELLKTFKETTNETQDDAGKEKNIELKSQSCPNPDKIEVQITSNTAINASEPKDPYDTNEKKLKFSANDTGEKKPKFLPYDANENEPKTSSEVVETSSESSTEFSIKSSTESFCDIKKNENKPNTTSNTNESKHPSMDEESEFIGEAKSHVYRADFKYSFDVYGNRLPQLTHQDFEGEPPLRPRPEENHCTLDTEEEDLKKARPIRCIHDDCQLLRFPSNMCYHFEREHSDILCYKLQMDTCQNVFVDIRNTVRGTPKCQGMFSVRNPNDVLCTHKSQCLPILLMMASVSKQEISSKFQKIPSSLLREGTDSLLIWVTGLFSKTNPLNYTLAMIPNSEDPLGLRVESHTIISMKDDNTVKRIFFDCSHILIPAKDLCMITNGETSLHLQIIISEE